MELLPPLNDLSRRDFLRLCSLAVLGGSSLWLPKLEPRETEADFQGRVLESTLQVYDNPSYSGKLVKVLWKDLIVPIRAATIGDGEPDYNRVWYRIDEGYVHSGEIQPVQIKQNQPDPDIPEQGRLAEVTVPFTEARWKPVNSARLSYRLYYGTTHWVTRYLLDDLGAPLYEIFDDKWKFNYYVNANHLRLTPYEELHPLSPEVPQEARRLEVRLEQQVVIAYENDRAVFMSRAATGGKFSTGNYETPTGKHITNHKRPTRHMAAGDRAAPNSYDLPGVPWVCYFTPEGVSFHGTFWHNDFGRPRSHGCINLPVASARWIYRWTLPVVPPGEIFTFEKYGTIVDIF